MSIQFFIFFQLYLTAYIFFLSFWTPLSNDPEKNNYENGEIKMSHNIVHLKTIASFPTYFHSYLWRIFLLDLLLRCLIRYDQCISSGRRRFNNVRSLRPFKKQSFPEVWTDFLELHYFLTVSRSVCSETKLRNLFSSDVLM